MREQHQEGRLRAAGGGIDMDAIRANQKLTPEERILKLKKNANFILNLRTALKSSRANAERR